MQPAKEVGLPSFFCPLGRHGMWKCCSQPHHCITNSGIKALYRFFGALLDGVQFLHQSVLIRHDPKVIVESGDQLVQVHVGSMGHNVQCHISFNGLVCNWHDQLISAATQVEETNGILPHLISHGVRETS